jgi:cytochrome c553
MKPPVAVRTGPWRSARVLLLAALLTPGACDDTDPPPPDAAVDAVIAGPVVIDGGDVAAADAAADLGDDTAPDATPDLASDLAAYPRPNYQTLAETGLYADFANRVVAADIRTFTPAHQLWSDAAEKQRWIRLPPGSQIDTAEMDHWQFPVGTKLWKQFGHHGQALETRLVERYGPGPEDYWMGSFVWSADGTTASFALDGQADINGSQHDAPPVKACGACHRGDKGRVLGLSALQSSHDGPGLTLDTLAADGRLSHPPPPGTRYRPPGDPVTAAAFGYLHAICGHCHNRTGTAWPDTQATMRLYVADTVATEAAIYKTLVGQKVQYWRHPTLTTRVVAGDPAASAVLGRMTARGSKDQMPPLATELTDATGVDTITRWIQALPR